MIDPPDFMVQAGIAWRYAKPIDLKFIMSCWFHHGMKPFVRGPGCPFPGLHATVEEARRKENIKLLQLIYHREMKRLIGRSILRSLPLVAFDQEDEVYIIGFANADYAYVREHFRRQGIGRALREAVGLR